MAASATLTARLEQVVGEASGRAADIGDALIGVAEFLASRASLRRALTDAGRTPDSRATLARQLFDGRIDESALDLVAEAVGARWARTTDLVAALVELGLMAHLAAAESRGELDRVEDEVFRFGQLVRGNPTLRAALLDRAAPAEARRTLVRSLLDGKAEPETIRLVEYAVLERRERSLEKELDRIAELAAARHRRQVAVVRVATPLTPEHRDRLARALSAQAGAPVQLNVVVEPELVGGIKVEIGDEIVDGTVAGRLEDARRRLAGTR